MGWRIVVQPDGKYARFGDIVDDFTHMNMAREEAIEVCRTYPGMGAAEAEEKVGRAEAEPGRWTEAIKTIRIIHGDAVAAARMREVARPTPSDERGGE
jgi:hypothetical protein